MHKGFKISIVDKMPPPSDLGSSRRRGGSYGDDSEGGDDPDAGDDQAERDAPDRDAKISAVADFFSMGKKGDNEGALSALEDLMDMCSRG
jgi:hypothetical protein